MKNEIVVLGELNADLILRNIPSFPEMGKEKTAGGMRLTMGSASAITASNIARLGIKTGFVGKLGKDVFAEVVLATLKDRKVDVSAIVVDPDEQTGVTVALTYPEDYAMVTYMGAMERFVKSDVNFEYLKNAAHLHFSSYYLQPGIRPAIAEIFRFARENGLTTSCDPGWDPAEEWREDIYEMLDYTDVFMPNEREALFISGCKDIDDAAEKLRKHAGTVMIKQGSKGSLLLSSEGRYKTRTFNVTPVDTTGAGDSFNAGYLYGFLKKKDAKTCLLYGNACGGLATTKMGGAESSPTAEELESFLAERQNEDIFIA